MTSEIQDQVFDFGEVTKQMGLTLVYIRVWLRRKQQQRRRRQRSEPETECEADAE